MAWEYGQDYGGLFAEEYQAIWDLNNSTINDWLQANMTPVNGGEFYVLNPGVEDYEWIELYQGEFGVDAPLDFFTYLKSTWVMAGF